MKVSEESENNGGEFDDELFSPSRVKACKTRREKRQSRREHWEAARQDSVLESVTVSAAKLRELQENDNTLLKVRQSTYSNVNPSVDNPFHRQDGLLYRQWQPHGQDTEQVVSQLVLPKQCREKVLMLAHSIPMAGHLAKEKTRQRIMKHFYWPTLYKDVEIFVVAVPNARSLPKKQSLNLL